ncbi:MAG TPA: BMP family ABC transporter substrate-binding protein [Ktedonobacterales bacterium]|jgi:basic membrane protein A
MRSTRFRGLLFAGPILILTLLFSACGTNPPANTPTAKYQVGLVTDIGGLNDRGFNQLAHEGYEKAEKQYGFKDSVIQTANSSDYVTNLTTSAKTNDLVIGVGFLMQGAIDQVAKANPTKKFALVDGCATLPNQFDCDPLPNVTPLFFKEQEAGCLVGAVAGQMELDGKAVVPKLLGANTIGAVGGIEVPAVDRYIAGYQFCAKKVNPNVKVVITYSNDFNDVSKCKDAADAQIKQKQADIIFQVAGGCGVGALDAASADGVYGIGVDADQSQIHPDSVITSAIKRVDTAVFTISDLMEKDQYPADPINFPHFALSNDGVGAGPFNSAVPSDAQTLVKQYTDQIKSGALVPPQDCSPATTCATS